MFNSQILRTPLFGLLLITLCGCSYHGHFEPYKGPQAAWPVDPDATHTELLGMKIYEGPPEKPYTILGTWAYHRGPVDLIDLTPHMYVFFTNKQADAAVITVFNDEQVAFKTTGTAIPIGNAWLAASETKATGEHITRARFLRWIDSTNSAPSTATPRKTGHLK